MSACMADLNLVAMHVGRRHAVWPRATIRSSFSRRTERDRQVVPVLADRASCLIARRRNGHCHRELAMAVFQQKRGVPGTTMELLGRNSRSDSGPRSGPRSAPSTATTTVGRLLMALLGGWSWHRQAESRMRVGWNGRVLMLQGA